MLRPTIAAFGLALLAGLGSSQAGENQLKIYNWSDYIADTTIADFQQSTGIQVTYDVFDSNEMLEGKLLAGNSGFDLVVPSAAFLGNQIKAGIYQKLDRALLPNWGNLDPAILKLMAATDPGNAHGVPYMWGTTGIAYNVDKIRARMASAPLDSWALVFDPKIVAKFADCGVAMLDAPGEMFEIIQNYLGVDRNSARPQDLEKVRQAVAAIQPHIRYFHNSSQIDDLANGEICLAVGWSGDMFQAINSAKEAGAGVNLAYAIPREGTTVWFDLLAIPADAGNAQAAHEFINYVLEPKTIAAITNQVWYANPNPASLAFVAPRIKNNPAIYPPPQVMGALFADRADPQPLARARNRIWARARAGN
ncbi:MAG: polyamine ABC transporter substrate-binding protein [Alphaproteobacteria bacterium]